MCVSIVTHVIRENVIILFSKLKRTIFISFIICKTYFKM